MEASKLVEEVIEYQYCTILGYEAHKDTIMITWMIMIGFLVFCLVVRRGLKTLPGHMQTVMEMMVEGFQSLSCSMAGEKGKAYAPFLMSLFLFILSCNWLGLLPAFLKVGHLHLAMPPTRDISTTVALALIAFFSFHYFGIRAKGFKYFLHYIHPIPLLVRTLPRNLLILIPPLFCLFVFLNIVEEVARILSLSVRLMGNILGEHIVASSLILFCTIVLNMSYFLVPFADILPLFVLFLGLLTGGIQAFIFSVLTLSFISHAVASDEEH